jgi:uncharacterized protein
VSTLDQPAADAFVPLSQLRRRKTPRTPAPRFDAEVLDSVGHQLDSFALTLEPAERAALVAMLRRADPKGALKALAALPAEALFTPDEIAVIDRLLAAPAPTGQGLRSTLVLIMKASRRCNLRCTYCHFWSDEPNSRMSFEVLARTVHGALAAPGVRTVEFVWHGGETTLLPLSFYRRALWLQQRFARPGQTVLNAMQTNGTNLTNRWLNFIQDYRFDVGVSLDGPPEVNDLRRVDVAGRPTSARVCEGLAKLRGRGIEHGVLMVVDEAVIALGARRVLDYFLDNGIEAVALLNVLPENTGEGAEMSGTYVAWARFVEFLREMFHLWWPRYADRIRFREISDLMGKIQGQRGKICVFDGNCMGGYLTIEPTGEVSSCDKYRGDMDYRFGSVLTMDLADLPAQPRFVKADAYTATGIDHTESCPWYGVCQGGCPHDRYVRVQHGIPHDESCCGLAPLLSDMAKALGQANQQSSCSK